MFSQNKDGFRFSILNEHVRIYSNEQTKHCLGKALNELIKAKDLSEKIAIKEKEERLKTEKQQQSNVESWSK